MRPPFDLILQLYDNRLAAILDRLASESLYRRVVFVALQNRAADCRGGFMAEMFDRTYYRRKVAQNRQMAADAQTDHVRDVHLRLCDFYTLALSVSDDLAEPPVLMVRNS